VNPAGEPAVVDPDAARPTADAAPTSDADRIEVLQRRLQRERAARRESERISESGLRRLWEAKHEVDRQVEERTAQLRAAQRQAQLASDAKTEFLANLSHEVRTPLQTILAALELTDERTTSAGSHRRQAIDAALALRSLFDDLLELAECEVGSVEVHLRPVELQAVADTWVQRWRAPLTERGLLLVPETSGSARVDPDRLGQIADALLSNAAKFARPGTVELGLRRVDERVELVVRDGGPAVPSAELSRIFEPFVQLHGGNDRVVGGAGIGLALVRGLARRMGGDAAASLTPGGGLQVQVWIPSGDRS
jgi:signal transduction histidine kinase